MRSTYAKRAQAARIERDRQAFLKAGGQITQCQTPDWDSLVNKKVAHHGAMSAMQGGVSA